MLCRFSTVPPLAQHGRVPPLPAHAHTSPHTPLLSAFTLLGQPPGLPFDPSATCRVSPACASPSATQVRRPSAVPTLAPDNDTPRRPTPLHPPALRSRVRRFQQPKIPKR